MRSRELEEHAMLAGQEWMPPNYPVSGYEHSNLLAVPGLATVLLFTIA